MAGTYTDNGELIALGPVLRDLHPKSIHIVRQSRGYVYAKSIRFRNSTTNISSEPHKARSLIFPALTARQLVIMVNRQTTDLTKSSFFQPRGHSAESWDLVDVQESITVTGGVSALDTTSTEQVRYFKVVQSAT